MPLLVGSPHQAKLCVEEVMALKPLKLPRYLPLAAPGDLRHRDLAVVVADLSRHAADESEGTIVALEKGLGALPWKCLDKDGVGVRQRHHEQRHLLPLTGDVDVREAEVDLCLARRMRERHEDFLPGVLPLPDRRFHHRDAAGVVPLCLQPVENPLRRVVLLLGRFLVLLQYLVDPRQVWPQNRFLTLRPTAISGRLGVREHLPERPPVDAVFLAGRPLRQFAGQHPAPDLGPHLHRCIHSSCLALGRGKSRLRRDSPLRDHCTVVRCIFRPTGLPRRALHFSTGVHTRQDSDL